MSDPRFRRGLKISTTVHVVVLLLLSLWPLFQRLFHPRKPPEMITFVDLVAGDPLPPAPEIKAPLPKPEPEKPKPEPEPEKPITEPVKTDKPKIKVNTNKIVRKNDVVETKPKKPTLTKEQINKMLSDGLPRSAPGRLGGAAPTALQAYYGQVYQVMYGAWRQPSGAGVSGIRTQVKVKVQRSGFVVFRQKVSGSGSVAMDASVMTAVQSVSRLPPFPTDIPDDSLEIVVEFVLEGP